MLRIDEQQKKNKELINMLRATLYNDLTNFMLDEIDIELNNIDHILQKNVIKIIFSILQASIALTNEILIGNNKISLENCPLNYMPFLTHILNIKQKYDLLSPDKTNIQPDVDTMIATLAKSVITKPPFNTIMDEIKLFILEAKGLMNATLLNVKWEETGVTTDLIRETFYNEMIMQVINAVKDNLIFYDDLNDQETSIYFALPALTLLQAINESHNCEGIRLLNNKMLTRTNCPQEENFPELFGPILQIKEQIRKLTPNELRVIKFMCLSSNKSLPEELKDYQSSYIMSCVKTINSVASIISQRGVFKNQIEKVIGVCLDILKPNIKNVM